ncbi:MAG: 4Fe-4S dicluster domain-containing protein [bacterium]
MKKFYISSACFHCNSPACASACAVGALVKRSDGTVNHLQHRCIGCGYCIQACPFKVPQFNPAQNIMRKCSFCTQRIDRGRLPACVAKCTTKALVYHPEGKIPIELQDYGEIENLHMIYKLVHKAEEYGLPVPVPLNTTTENQLWMWLAGLLPAIGMTFVLIRMAQKIEGDKGDE